MSFTSFQFILFFGIIYILNWSISNLDKNISVKKYKIILLIESVCFVVIADWKTVISLIMLTVICQLAAVLMNKDNFSNATRKRVLAVGLIIAIGQLGLFKYYDFFAENMCKMVGRIYTSSKLCIPIGISFFTFSAVAYLIDVYREKYKAYESGLDLAVYLFFFPKLVSGPIVRPDKFQEQLNEGKKRINLDNLQTGIQYVVWGLFKKMVLADHLAVFVDDVFGAPVAFASVTCIWAMVSYSLQIYFDFSGYSDMAIGFSKMLGIDIENNFDLPYISRNVTEFWKRWHISLSSWLQDYVYISLGGNRKGLCRTKINLILTMFIGGLWHGAEWTFVIWGGIHGIALVIQKEFHKKRNKSSMGKLGECCSVIFTFIYITLTWVFFRADSIENAFLILKQAFSIKTGITQIYSWTWMAITFIIYEVALARINQKRKQLERTTVCYPIVRLDSAKNLMFFFVLIGLTIILAYVGETAFIYGQF